MSRTWENSLLSMESLAEELSEEPKLRHDLPWIKASDVGQHYYCEQKVALNYELGEIETEAIARGRAMHDELTEGLEEVSIEECIKKIKTKKAYGVCNFRILTEIEGIPLGGVLDDVIFYETKPVLVADLKTTSRPSLWPGHDKPVQIRTYGLGLDYMGFDCSKLKLMIGVERFGIREELEWIPYKVDLFDIYKSLEEGHKIDEVKEMKAECYYRWIRDYDKSRALDEFNWASEYWLGDRNAIPTKYMGKCKVCVYKEECPKSNI